MLHKNNIPAEFQLPSDLHEQLAELYQFLGHSNFVRMNSFARTYFQVCSRIKLLDKIYTELLDNDENGSQYKKQILSRDYRSVKLALGVCPPAWVSSDSARHNHLLESARIDNIFHRRLSSLGTLDNALDVLLNEMSYVKSVYNAFGELRFECFTRLDINNTIDHHNLKEVIKEWNKYLKENPEKVVRYGYNVERVPSVKDDVAKELIKSQYKSRGSQWTQRVLNEMRIAHENGWYMVFDTLTLADSEIRRFYESPNALRDYFRSIQREVMAAEGITKKATVFTGYKYFCAPEFGSKEGRLHYHVVHLMRTLPTWAKDPNISVRMRTKREIRGFTKFWSYGLSQPIAVRYSGDSFTKSGWFWPQDKNGIAMESKPWQAVAYYVTKYVTKKTDIDIAQNEHLQREDKKWNNRVNKLLGYIPKHNFRMRATRKFGLELDSMKTLSLQALYQMIRLPYQATPLVKIVAWNSRKELAQRLNNAASVADIVQIKQDSVNLLHLMRQLRENMALPEVISKVMSSLVQTLTVEELSDETLNYLQKARVASSQFQTIRKTAFGSK